MIRANFVFPFLPDSCCQVKEKAAEKKKLSKQIMIDVEKKTAII